MAKWLRVAVFGVASSLGVPYASASMITDPWIVDVRQTTAAIRVAIDDGCASKNAYTLQTGATPSTCQVSEGGQILTWNLTGLVASGNYDYSVRGGGTHRDVRWRQAASPSTAIKFVVLGDTQGYRQYDLSASLWRMGGRVYPRGFAPAGYSVADMRSTYQFGVLAGDWWERGGETGVLEAFQEFHKCNPDYCVPQPWTADSPNWWTSGATALPLLNHLPLYVAPGNHEHLGGCEGGAGNYPAGNLNGTLKFWGHASDYCYTPIDPSPATHYTCREPKAYGYGFAQGKATFIVFNGMMLGGTHCDDATPLHVDSYTWLRRQVAAAASERKSRPFIVLVNHFFWASRADSHSVNNETHRTRLRNIVEEFSVDVVIGGHAHLTEFGRLGYAPARDTLQIISGAASGHLQGCARGDCADSYANWSDEGGQFYQSMWHTNERYGYVDGELPVNNDVMTFRAISHATVNTLAAIDNRVEYTAIQYGRVPRRIEGRPTTYGGWHYYGPYELAQGDYPTFTVQTTGDVDLYVKVGGRPTANSYDCAKTGATGTKSCVVNLPNGSTQFWIGTKGRNIGTTCSSNAECGGNAQCVGPVPLAYCMSQYDLSVESSSCRIVNGVRWCYNPNACGQGCSAVCSSLGLPLTISDAAWLAAQDTNAECQAISSAFGVTGEVGNWQYGCMEDRAGGHSSPGGLVGPLLCSNYAGCPAAHRATMDNAGVSCANGGRRSLCPCQ